MNCDELGFDRTASAASVTELRGKFPNLPIKVLVTLAVMECLARTVTPFRLCACGCGESVHGKARLASMACRQRVSRQMRAIRAASGRQFNLVMQYEIPVPIPTVPPPRDHGSAPVADYPGQSHIEVLNRAIVTEYEIGMALLALTNGKGGDFVPSHYNNLRLALGRSLAYDFEKLAKRGIYPGVVVEYNGARWGLKRFELVNAANPLLAELCQPDFVTGPYKLINPSYLEPSQPSQANRAKPTEPELFREV